MTDISAKLVMELRAKTGVSMMQCKKALVETGGDMDAAIDVLRKKGAAKAADKADRTTSEGAIFASGNVLLALACETDFVARNEDFVAFGQSLAEIAQSDGTEAAEKVFAEQQADKITQVGENIQLLQIATIDGDLTGIYVHSNAKAAAIVALDGGSEEVAKDIAMHVVAMKPSVVSPDQVDDSTLAHEKEIWAEQLKNEGKPENIIDNILQGKEKKFREESALIKQSFVKNQEQSVEQFAAEHSAEVEGFIAITI